MAYNPYHRPGKKGARRKPSSQHGGGKRKAWVSLRETNDGRMDTGRRRQDAWWRCPMMKEARAAKWAA